MILSENNINASVIINIEIGRKYINKALESESLVDNFYSLNKEVFFLFKLMFKYFVSVFSLLLSPTPAIPTSHPPSYPPLALSLCRLYMFLDNPLPFSPIIPSHLPSGYFVLYSFVSGHIFLYFNVCGYILLACLFCWLGSTYRWDHMVFVFHRLFHVLQHIICIENMFNFSYYVELVAKRWPCFSTFVIHWL